MCPANICEPVRKNIFVKRFVKFQLHQWRNQPKIFEGPKIWGITLFDFRRPTEFYLGHRFSKHKVPRNTKKWRNVSLGPPLTAPMNSTSSYRSLLGRKIMLLWQGYT